MDISGLIKEIKTLPEFRDVVLHREIGAAPPEYKDPAPALPGMLSESLQKNGITRLFSHQALGLNLIRSGKNLVVMTPASSGKSLVYNLPVVESIINDNESRALYLFPLKGLEQDQLRAFRELTANIRQNGAPTGRGKGFSPGLSEIYDGDTSAYRRKKIRENLPRVIMTNPDMLHLALNPFHWKWEGFFKNLKFVVIDEVHAYRGVFGSHVAHVLRRLRRVAMSHGANPQFIASSATIANPAGLAKDLTGLDFELVDFSGAPQGKRHFIFINPSSDSSPYTIAARLFARSVKSGLKTIAFTKARKVTELMHARMLQNEPSLAKTVSSYRAGFLPEERREIERRLFCNELTGVISTSALELGVDIGGLDVCILVGYPGSISSAWQRAGRAGRSGRDSLIVMLGLQDALDQHFMRNPDDFFRRGPEAAVVSVENPFILKSHLLCAATEAYLKPTDKVYEMRSIEPLLKELAKQGKLRHWEKGDIWWPRRKYPHRDVSIREAGEALQICDANGTLIGESSGARALYELYPGAVYLHKGVQYLVKKLDLVGKKALCAEAGGLSYYTSAITYDDTEIISEENSASLNGVQVSYGVLLVTKEVHGYRKKHLYTGKLMSEHPLSLPKTVFSTKGVWMKVDAGLIEEIKSKRFDKAGALHALEHAAIAALPLFALCDRMDIGGVSYPLYPALEGAAIDKPLTLILSPEGRGKGEGGSAAIFIYDGYEGGVGLTKEGFGRVKDWFKATLDMMEDCPCESSCPSCTQDPKCGNNNEPLDKRGAILILKNWLGS
ncbi:MAG: DEAD/DEAH box helicase [Deltaproteobacteria bacterium]|nr:DEAD/DEAH box helicase [Deltaproteobacteria bacterium]